MTILYIAENQSKVLCLVSNTTFLNRTNWIIVRDLYIGIKHGVKKFYASIAEIVGHKIWNVELGQQPSIKSSIFVCQLLHSVYICLEVVCAFKTKCISITK